MMALLAGCGGGGSGGGVGDMSSSTGSLTVTSSKTAADAGTSIAVTAQYSLPTRSNGLNGLSVSFFSPDHPELLNPASAMTNDSGLAQATVFTNNSITKPVVFTIVAKLQDLQSAPVSVTLNPVNIDIALGALTMTTSSGSVSAGSSFGVTAAFTHPYVKDLHGLTITFSSDNPDIVPAVTATTDINGKAVATMTAKNVITTPTSVGIIAKLGSLSTTPVLMTVNPPTMILTPPTDGTFTVAKAPAGSVVRVVISGANVVVKNAAGNPIQNQPVTISVQTIVNKSDGDQVVFFPDSATQIIAPPGSITLTTDTNGKVIIPLAVDLVAPAPAVGSQHVINVVWSVSTVTPGGTLVGTASTLYTLKNE
jgi:hypothetical protein